MWFPRELKIPEKARLSYEKGMHCVAKNDAAGGMGHFQRAIAAFPDFYQAYYSMGVAQRQLHQEAQAMESFQTAIDRAGGQCPLAEFAVGLRLAERHKLAEAEAVLRRALQHDTSYAKGYLYLGGVLHHLDRLDEPEKCAREAEKRDPELAPAYLLLANIHARKGDKQEELRDVEKSLRANPGEARQDAREVYEQLQKQLHQGPAALRP
jgi:tetratricopeptide (TPR) repeat protein